MEAPRNTFSKSERLCGELRIARLFKEGKGFVCYPFRVCWNAFPEGDESVPPEASRVQVLMSVPKKRLRRANRRNRVKRLLRESFRCRKHEICDMAQARRVFVQVAFIWIANDASDFAHVDSRMAKALERMATALNTPTQP